MKVYNSIIGAPEANAENDNLLPIEVISTAGVAQLQEAYMATADLKDKALTAALDQHFGKLKEKGELVGGEAIQAWAEDENRHSDVALVIEALPGVTEMSDEERERVGIVETLYVAHLLGTPWRRTYENDSEPIQHVKPDKKHWGMEVSSGSAQLWPHNEILPTHDGTIICSEFSTLFAVHNTNSGSPTTLYNAQKAIAELPSETVELLKQPNFKYVGTILENEADDTKDIMVPVLEPVFGEDGKIVSYDLLADLDDVTMTAMDAEGWKALRTLRDQMMANEAAYTITDGRTLVWRNRKALHGRREVTDPERHLVRSQVGEADYANAG